MEVEQRVRQTAQWLLARYRQPGGRVSGWGQFVDPVVGGSQVGWYGTVAAAGVLSIAGETIPAAALAWLEWLWVNRATDKQAAGYFAQNARLAIGSLALARSTEPNAHDLATEWLKELLTRRHNDGTWGEWYISAQERDPHSSAFTSALCLLAVKELNRGGVYANDLRRSATALSAFIAGTHTNAPEQILLPLAAIATALPRAQIKGPIAGLMWKTIKAPPGRDEVDVNLYSFRFAHGGGRHFDRDYLVIPRIFSYLILAVELRNRVPDGPFARRGVNDVLREIPDRTEHLYKREPDIPVATLDQFFMAHALTRARSVDLVDYHDPLSMAVVWLVQEENLATRVVLPLFLAIAVAIGATEPTLLTDLPYVGERVFGFATTYPNATQIVSIVGATTLGTVLVGAPFTYLRKKFGRS